MTPRRITGASAVAIVVIVAAVGVLSRQGSQPSPSGSPDLPRRTYFSSQQLRPIVAIEGAIQPPSKPVDNPTEAPAARANAPVPSQSHVGESNPAAQGEYPRAFTDEEIAAYEYVEGWMSRSQDIKARQRSLDIPAFPGEDASADERTAYSVAMAEYSRLSRITAEATKRSARELGERFPGAVTRTELPGRRVRIRLNWDIVRGHTGGVLPEGTQ